MITYVLAIIIIELIIFQHFERKDLYNRIMSRDLSEYKGGKTKSPLSAHEKVLKRWREKEGDENGKRE